MMNNIIKHIHSEIDKFGGLLGRAKDMNESIQLFKAGHHAYSTTVSGMLGQMAHTLLNNQMVPERVKGSITAYINHFNMCRTLEARVMDSGDHEKQVKCIQAFLTDLGILKEATSRWV